MGFILLDFVRDGQYNAFVRDAIQHKLGTRSLSTKSSSEKNAKYVLSSKCFVIVIPFSAYSVIYTYIFIAHYTLCFFTYS